MDTSTSSSLQMHLVTPGECITTQSHIVLRGHGTYVDPKTNALHSSVCGVVERVNKLISVRPLRARYTGEIGDVIVGRITEVLHNKWKVDIQGRQDATLLLSSINLPFENEQRRKTYEDQLNMRNIFVEDDLISAEVQSFQGDNTIHLQTRNNRYGKLSNGLFVRVYSALVKRCKQHFYTFEQFGITIILGNNGYIWIQSKEQEQNLETLKQMSKIRNAILALQSQFLPISPQNILLVCEDSIHLEPKQMLQMKNEITQRVLVTN